MIYSRVRGRLRCCPVTDYGLAGSDGENPNNSESEKDRGDGRHYSMKNVSRSG